MKEEIIMFNGTDWIGMERNGQERIGTEWKGKERNGKERILELIKNEKI